MLKVSPSRIASVLDLKTKELEEVVYFVSYMVLDAGNSNFLESKLVLDLGNAKSSQKTRERLLNVITEEVLQKIEDTESRDYRKATRMLEELKDSSIPFSIDEAAELISKYTGAKFGIGAEAIEYLLKNIDLDKEITSIRQELAVSKSTTDRSKLTKRLEALDAFKKSNSRPE
jgi:DNA-directed RNA polymerase subunit beta'